MANGIRWTPRWARGRTVIRLGEVSFAFYMMHRIVVVFGHLLLGGGAYSTPVAVGVILLFGTVAMLLGWGLMVLVERPMMTKFGGGRSRIRSVEPPRTDDQTSIAA